MPQLHLYLPHPTAKQLRERARSRGISVSKYLSEIVMREVDKGWPAKFFDEVAGGWKGELERPSQGEIERREQL